MEIRKISLKFMIITFSFTNFHLLTLFRCLNSKTMPLNGCEVDVVISFRIWTALQHKGARRVFGSSHVFYITYIYLKMRLAPLLQQRSSYFGPMHLSGPGILLKDRLSGQRVVLYYMTLSRDPLCFSRRVMC